MEQVFWLLCFANSQLLVVCMHVCEHTASHHFNVKIALNISGLGALHTGRDALQYCLKVKANWPCPQTAQIRGLITVKIEDTN